MKKLLPRLTFTTCNSEWENYAGSGGSRRRSSNIADCKLHIAHCTSHMAHGVAADMLTYAAAATSQPPRLPQSCTLQKTWTCDSRFEQQPIQEQKKSPRNPRNTPPTTCNGGFILPFYCCRLAPCLLPMANWKII